MTLSAAGGLIFRLMKKVIFLLILAAPDVLSERARTLQDTAIDGFYADLDRLTT